MEYKHKYIKYKGKYKQLKLSRQNMSLPDTFLINDKYKSILAENIQKEYNKLVITYFKVPETDRSLKNINGTGGVVSANDIIAYQIGWGKLVSQWYKEGIQNKQPIMPGDGFTTWDYNGLAKHFYDKYKYNESIKYIEQFREVVKDILNIVENEYQNGNLDKIGVWSWCTLKSGKKWPLSKWIQINTVAPFKKATGLIKNKN